MPRWRATAASTDIAKLFEEAANVEANEHFAREADALKLAKTNEANLLDAMAGEHYENTKMYKEFATAGARGRRHGGGASCSSRSPSTRAITTKPTRACSRN